MIAKDCLDTNQKPIISSQKVEDAIQYLEINNLEWIVILDSYQKLVGYLNYEYLCTLNPDSILEEFINKNAVPVSITSDTHWLRCMHILSKSILKNLAVVGPKSSDFKGIITYKSILKSLQNSETFNDEGAWIWLKIPTLKFSLSEIDRFANINGVQITGLVILERNDEFISFNLKTDKKVLQNFISSLQNLEYEVLGSFLREDIIDDSEDKFNYLLKYLDL